MENKELQHEISYKEFEKRYGSEILEILMAFPPERRKVILSLPDEKLNLWAGEKFRLLQLVKRKYRLEEALYKDQIPPEELSEANSMEKIFSS